MVRVTRQFKIGQLSKNEDRSNEHKEGQKVESNSAMADTGHAAIVAQVSSGESFATSRDGVNRLTKLNV